MKSFYGNIYAFELDQLGVLNVYRNAISIYYRE
jgi:hypothetical protein